MLNKDRDVSIKVESIVSNAHNIMLYSSTIMSKCKASGVSSLYSSSEKVFSCTAPTSLQDATLKMIGRRQEKKCVFGPGCIDEESGYLTEENSKLAALAVYVARERGAEFWENLYRSSFSVSYPKNERWDDDIILDGCSTLDSKSMRSYPIACLMTHPNGILFLDMPQLLWVDFQENIKLSYKDPDTDVDIVYNRQNYYYDSQNRVVVPTSKGYRVIWDVRTRIPKNNCVTIVGWPTTSSKPIGTVTEEVISSTIIFGHAKIPDGTKQVTVRRLNGSQTDSYYFLPKTNYKVRSVKECQHFGDFLSIRGGDCYRALGDYLNLKATKDS